MGFTYAEFDFIFWYAIIGVVLSALNVLIEKALNHNYQYNGTVFTVFVFVWPLLIPYWVYVTVKKVFR